MKYNMHINKIKLPSIQQIKNIFNRKDKQKILRLLRIKFNQIMYNKQVFKTKLLSVACMAWQIKLQNLPKYKIQNFWKIKKNKFHNLCKKVYLSSYIQDHNIIKVREHKIYWDKELNQIRGLIKCLFHQAINI